MSRHEVSESLIENSLEIQSQIDKAEKCIDDMDIKGLFDLGMIDRRVYQNWIEAEENEQDLVDTHGSDFYNPSFDHYYRAMEKADKNINRLKKEVEDLVSKSRSVLRQASRVANAYMSKTAGSGAENARYLNSISPQEKLKILKHIADHYGVSVREIEEELVDQDAEKLFEYAASNNAMAMKIYRGMSRMASTKTAASGNYGYTKAVQNDVEVALRKLEKKVNSLARMVENKHPEAGSYFSTRCQGLNCNASKALGGACLLNQKPKRMVAGPLGFKPSCARASHKAITDLILYSGEVAHSLHSKSRNHVPYLETHAKNKRCPLTRLLLENYPVEIL
jgi:hypothetical protein